MIEIRKKNKCCGCYGCYNICPVNAISMKDDKYGFKYPVVDKEKCINCGMCEKVCPILNKPKHNNKPIAYAAYNKNENERMQSSSGGIFTLIAKEILKNEGVVYGASFDNNFLVKHTRIDNINDIKKLRTSKYVQSQIENTYKMAKKDLNDQKIVLFTGTPCQVNGLYAYLQKNYDNLYTQDIICHGVPSPKVWEKYLQYRKYKDQKQPNKINFREKVPSGWNGFSLSFDDYYNAEHDKDGYMKMFLQNVSLRESCYACKFKDKNRISDITLADFWGINTVEPEMSDDKGISLVIVNSGKGKKLFSDISKDIEKRETDLDEAIKYNSAMVSSVAMNNNRENFFKELDSLKFDELIKKYEYKEKLSKKLIKKCKRIAKKVLGRK